MCEDSLVMMVELQCVIEVVVVQFEVDIGVNLLKYVVMQIGGLFGWGLLGIENKESYQFGVILIELIDVDFWLFLLNEFVVVVQIEV